MEFIKVQVNSTKQIKFIPLNRIAAIEFDKFSISPDNCKDAIEDVDGILYKCDLSYLKDEYVDNDKEGLGKIISLEEIRKYKGE